MIQELTKLRMQLRTIIIKIDVVENPKKVITRRKLEKKIVEKSTDDSRGGMHTRLCRSIRAGDREGAYGLFKRGHRRGE